MDVLDFPNNPGTLESKRITPEPVLGELPESWDRLAAIHPNRRHTTRPHRYQDSELTTLFGISLGFRVVYTLFGMFDVFTRSLHEYHFHSASS